MKLQPKDALTYSWRLLPVLYIMHFLLSWLCQTQTQEAEHGFGAGNTGGCKTWSVDSFRSWVKVAFPSGWSLVSRLTRHHYSVALSWIFENGIIRYFFSLGLPEWENIDFRTLFSLSETVLCIQIGEFLFSSSSLINFHHNDVNSL